MDLKISKWMYLAAVFLFCAATFQITGGSMILGAVLFGAGACLAFAARVYQKKSDTGSTGENRPDEPLLR